MANESENCRLIVEKYLKIVKKYLKNEKTITWYPLQSFKKLTFFNCCVSELREVSQDTSPFSLFIKYLSWPTTASPPPKSWQNILTIWGINILCDLLVGVGLSKLQIQYSSTFEYCTHSYSCHSFSFEILQTFGALPHKFLGEEFSIVMLASFRLILSFCALFFLFVS